LLPVEVVAVVFQRRAPAAAAAVLVDI